MSKNFIVKLYFFVFQSFKRNDSALILFLDGRYAEDRIQLQLPEWITKRSSIYQNFPDAQKHIAKFCKQFAQT